MARDFTDGGEDPAGLLVWSGVTGCAIVTSPKRSGARAIQVAQSAHNVYRNFPADDEIYCRICVDYTYNNNTPAFYLRKGTTNLVGIGFDVATQRFTAVVGNSTVVATGTFVFALNVFYVLEIYVKLADAGGIIQLKVDGILDIDFSGDTKPGADTTMDNLYLSSNFNASTYYDDIAINTVAGGADNSWCGDGRVLYLPVNAAGDVTQLTPNTGTNYGAVDEATADGDTTYVEADTLGEYDLYNLAASGLAAGSIIKRVIPVADAKNTVADGGKVKLGIKTGGTEYFGSDITLTTSYLPISGTEQLINPQTGLAWTISDLDDLQVGVKDGGV